ncbi:transcriptional regulator, MarR family [Lachnospiraceae bacterium KM106-2]|nr:transcriptional regulator, MarR family [Lachnospiraceae bacterium KM106-2]
MELEESFGYLLGISARLVKHEFDQKLKEVNLTTSQWAVLKVLSEDGALTQAELAKKLHSDRATTGTVIDKLVGKELIKKEIHQFDRRAFVVTLCPETRALVASVTKQALATNHNVLRKFDEKEKELFMDFLERIVNNLSEEDENELEE